MASPRIKQTILATLAPLLVAPVTSCCGSEPPSYVGFDVAEWSLTPEMYADLLAYWEPIGHSPYDEWKFLTQREQCLVACAYFGGLTLVDVGIQGGRDVDYHSAEVDACGFGIPTDEADGWVSCQGVHKITPGCTTGRRPLRSSPALDLRPRHHQRLLDELAREEQVSVTAFEELAAQLVHHGAPPSLGYLVLQSARSADTGLTFAAIFLAAVLAFAFFAFTRALERRLVEGWHGEAAG